MQRHEMMTAMAGLGLKGMIYLATLPNAVLVLHAFQKKTQAKPQRDIDLAANLATASSLTVHVHVELAPVLTGRI